MEAPWANVPISPRFHKGFHREKNAKCSRYMVWYFGRLMADRVLMFWMLPEMFEKMVDNFFRTTKEASVQSDFEPEKIYFDKLHNRYNKPVQAKENTDARLGYQVDKKYVSGETTFGARTVASNTSHIIQTAVVGMLFHRVPEGFYADEDVKEGSFLYEDQFMYEKYVLQPNSAYCVPSGTRHLTMTCEKTLFSIHVVSADAALPELNLLSSTSTRKLNATQTPMNMYRDDKKSKFKRLKICTDT
ncbi:uncharacterized protein CDAR_296341 [Caerostris darwini]|uniref:Uncharacterized protein n=1 Tax=Caerostris darwini TaxID=1538125 RepID=A0AAV4PD36_9ARAC|nr:uncharacterized protein CDAR_296341 [Caerostris darwini]